MLHVSGPRPSFSVLLPPCQHQQSQPVLGQSPSVATSTRTTSATSSVLAFVSICANCRFAARQMLHVSGPRPSFSVLLPPCRHQQSQPVLGQSPTVATSTRPTSATSSVLAF